MIEVYRNLIVTDAYVALARHITETLAPVGGRGMWVSGLSASGLAPATHWFSTGYIDADFAAMLPLIEYTETDGEYVANWLSPGYPDMIFTLYTQAIQIPPTDENQEPDLVVPEFGLDDVSAMLFACDVTIELQSQAWSRLGLKLTPVNEASK